MADITISADLQQIEAATARVKELRSAIAQLEQSGNAGTGAFVALTNNLRTAEAALARFGITLSETIGATEALEARIRVPFAAVGREIDASIAATNRYTEATRRARTEADQFAAANALGRAGLGAAERGVAEIAAISATNSAIAEKGELYKQLALDAATYYAQVKNVERTEQALATASSGVANLAASNTARVENEALIAKQGLFKSLANDAAAYYTVVKSGELAYKESVASIEAAAAAHAKAGQAATIAGQAGSASFSLIELSARKAVNVVDELARGQRGALVSTFGSFVREAGILQTAISALSGPWGAFAAAGVAALAAVGYAAEQSYQRFRSIRDTTVELAQIGFGSNASRDLGTAEFDRIKTATNEYAGSVRALQTELNKLPQAAQASRTDVAQVATALGGLHSEEPSKAIEEFVKAANQGPEALAKFVEKLYGLQDATLASGRTLSETVRTMTDAEAAFRLIASTAASLPINQAGEGARKASNDFLELALTAGAMGESVSEASPIMQALAESAAKILDPLRGITVESYNLTSAIRAENAALEAGSATIDKRTHLLQELLDAEAGVARVRGGRSNEGTTRGESPGGGRAQDAAANLGAEALRTPLTASEEEAHRVRLENINSEAQARRADLEAQAKAADARRDEFLQTRVGALTSTGQVDSGQAEAAIKASAEYKALEEAGLEAHKRVEDQKTQITVDGLRAQIASEQRGTAERIAAQQQIIAITKQLAADGRASAQSLAQEQIRLESLKRQEATRTFQQFRDEARSQVELAKGNVEQINAAYDKLRMAAQQTGQAPAVGAQIDREQIRDLESAQTKAFSQEEQFISASEKLDSARIKQFDAGLATMVAAHKISKAQMEGFEIQYTAQVYAEEEKRLQAALETDGLTLDQKQKLYSELAELYAKDAEVFTQLQQKMTEAVEKENAERVKSFQTAFNSVGSNLERALTDAISGKSTGAQIAKQLQESLTGDLVKLVGGQLNQLAGKGLAKTFGVDIAGEKSTGVGDVLGKLLGDALGLTKKVSDDPSKIAADKLSLAAQTQEKAMTLSQDASKNLIEASKALLEAANKLSGTTSGTSPKTAASGTTYGPDPNDPDAVPASPSGEMGAIASPTKAKPIKTDSLGPIPADYGGGGDDATYYRTHNVGFPTLQNPQVAHFPGQSPSEILNALPNTEATPKTPFSSFDTPLWTPTNLLPPNWGKGDEVPRAAPVTGVTTETLKIDPASVAQGVSQGQIQAAGTIESSMAKGAAEGNVNLQDAIQADSATIRTQQASVQSSVNADQLNVQANQQNSQAVVQNTQALEANTAKQGQNTGDSGTAGKASGDTSTAGTGGSFNPLSILQQAVGALGQFVPGLKQVSSALGALQSGINGAKQLFNSAETASGAITNLGAASKGTQTATTLLQTANVGNTVATTANTTATELNSTAQEAGGGGGGVGGIFGSLVGGLFAEQGAIVPSAAGGMMVGDGRGGMLAIVHPREMILPAPISSGLQNMISRGSEGGNAGQAPVLNYNANVTGYHPFSSRSSFESMLRTNATHLERFVTNAARNGFRA